MDINGGTPKRMVYNGKSDQHGNWEVMNGNFRILKWRYCTIFQAIFVGIFAYIGLKNRPYIW